jgi:Mor family transcriptional regulator
MSVEAIGRNSNLGHLCKRWFELRKRVNESSRRPSGTPPRSKRFLVAADIDDIVHRYHAGETIEQIGAHFRISKSRVATVLREQGIPIRRQGLTIEQSAEAKTLYSDGKSLAWLGARYDVSHTTVAAALRRQGMQLRPAEGGVKPRCSLQTHEGVLMLTE